MDTNIFLPEKIKVGFQERNDTYTGLLGYVIYHDGKKWRKEPSWNGWRTEYEEGFVPDPDRGWYNRGKSADKKFEVMECKNELTEGFVLNKKVGGTSWSRNPRQTYCRIYDPRGFEFEITIQNLLYILDNTNSIIGKGLEGKFIYGWSGKDLWLIPENAPEYKEMVEFTQLQDTKLKKEDLEEGYVYRTKKNEKILYLGRYLQYPDGHGKKPRKKYYFFNLKEDGELFKSDWCPIFTRVSFANLAEKLDKHEDYAFAMDELEHCRGYSPASGTREYVDAGFWDGKSANFPGDYILLQGDYWYVGSYRYHFDYREESDTTVTLKRLDKHNYAKDVREVDLGVRYVDYVKENPTYKHVNILENGKHEKFYLY